MLDLILDSFPNPLPALPAPGAASEKLTASYYSAAQVLAQAVGTISNVIYEHRSATKSFEACSARAVAHGFVSTLQANGTSLARLLAIAEWFAIAHSGAEQLSEDVWKLLSTVLIVLNPSPPALRVGRSVPQPVLSWEPAPCVLSAQQNAVITRCLARVANRMNVRNRCLALSHCFWTEFAASSALSPTDRELICRVVTGLGEGMNVLDVSDGWCMYAQMLSGLVRATTTAVGVGAELRAALHASLPLTKTSLQRLLQQFIPCMTRTIGCDAFEEVPCIGWYSTVLCAMFRLAELHPPPTSGVDALVRLYEVQTAAAMCSKQYDDSMQQWLNERHKFGAGEFNEVRLPIIFLPLSGADAKTEREYERVAVYDQPTARRFFVLFEAAVAADIRALVAEQLMAHFPAVLCKLASEYCT